MDNSMPGGFLQENESVFQRQGKILFQIYHSRFETLTFNGSIGKTGMNPVFRCEFQQWVENIDYKKTELKLVSGYGKSLLWRVVRNCLYFSEKIAAALYPVFCCQRQAPLFIQFRGIYVAAEENSDNHNHNSLTG